LLSQREVNFAYFGVGAVYTVAVCFCWCIYRIVVVFDVDIIIKTIGVGFLRHMPRAVDFSLVFNAI
jgi:hypothetical protein